MQIIFLSRHHGAARSFAIDPRRGGLLVVLVFLLTLVSGVWLGTRLSGPLVITTTGGQVLPESVVHPGELREARADAQRQLDALSVHLADLQARMTRLDALGERLASLAGLDNGEFDFAKPVGQGGPDEPLTTADAQNSGDILKELDFLLARVGMRERQLRAMEHRIAEQQLAQAQMLAGWPVTSGYLSSTFGRRSDPFHGQAAMHKGVDFAARVGSEVKSVAAGVVTFAGRHPDYGWMVEISHSDGYSTLYAHNQSLSVQAGELVQRGQVIARVGNTGRSTGAHLHFEVKKGGQQVDPRAYLNRTVNQG